MRSGAGNCCKAMMPALLSVLAARNYVHVLIENRTAGKLEHMLSDSPCGFAILDIRFMYSIPDRRSAGWRWLHPVKLGRLQAGRDSL